jgi:myo-inositol-1(or 4)-monophosphatase
MSGATADPRELLALAEAAAAAAVREIAERSGGSRAVVATKSSETDLVTETDGAAERIALEIILAARPDDGVLGEEAGERLGSGGVRWVIDPIDGTTNFVYGYPQFAVSIAAEVEGQAVAGVVHDVVRGEVFTATRGGGAHIGGQAVRTTRHDRLQTALIGTGFSYDPARRARQAAALSHVLPAIRDIRRAGSAALDLCWVASGRLDAYWEGPLAPWDVAAGALIASEAGATVGSFVGRDGSVITLASVPDLYDELQRLLVAADA